MDVQDEIPSIYRQRFNGRQEKRNAVWKVLSRYFATYIPVGANVLDIACGYGEFINHLAERSEGYKLYAADINPDSRKYLHEDIVFLHAAAESIDLPDCTLNTVFASNFFEHLENAQVFINVLKNICRLLKDDGQLMVLQPDLKLCGTEYWDFLDHKFPVTVPRLVEAAGLVGLRPEKIIRRFLPYTMSGRHPAHPFLVNVYLKMMPLSGWFFGKQAFVIFRKK